MKVMRVLAALLLSVLAVQSQGAVVYSHAPSASGGHYKSSWYAPDGLDGDSFAYDSFILNANTAISEVRWRGCYTNYLSGAGQAPAYAFTISFYPSNITGFEPDVVNGPVYRRTFTGNAGETAVGTFGGVIMYDYAKVLPAPFQAVAGVKYWVRIEASQGLTPNYYWPPDWSMAVGTGGNGAHFQETVGEGPRFQMLSNDLAFSLYSSDAPTATIAASASPVEAGSIMGAGVYPLNSTVSLIATPNAGWGFVNWTQGASQVSTNSHYSFTATVNRTLVANFVPAYTITTAASPSYGGTTTGDGVFNEGTSVTVTATANPGYVFIDWSEYGMTASMSPTYTFTAQADRPLVANFMTDPLSAAFDFDDAPVHTSLPVDVMSNGIGAHLTGGYSIQFANALGFTPAGFGGRCVYPNSVFLADLTVDFSEPLTDFSIMYSPQELGCDNSARMRATGYMDGVMVATDTATVPQPGTWPTGTLRLHSAAVFNRVVVHYDARPPTCQDYGMIFLADNMTVTRACLAPGIVSGPAPAATCPVGAVNFVVAANGNGLGYRWQREETPGTFVDLVDGPTASWDGGGPGVGAIVSGSGTDTLSISAATADGLRLSAAHAVRYRCVVSSACGSATSDGALLTVCPADWNCFDGLDSQDYFDFLESFFGGDADFNGYDGTDSQDYFDFLEAFFSGC